MYSRQVLVFAIYYLLVAVDSIVTFNDQDGGGNDTCIDVTPPNFDINFDCGSLVAGLIDGCYDPILATGNYCARSCQRATCTDPLSMALFKIKQQPVDEKCTCKESKPPILQGEYGQLPNTNASIFEHLKLQGFNAPVVWLKEFGSEFDIIHVQDIDGDKLSDIVAFGEGGVYVALSTGTYFETPSLWSTDFGSGPTAGQWKEFSLNPRLLGDVNGDGLSDIIGFYSDGTYVALNDGNSFEPTEKWSTGFGVATGWNNDTQRPRYMMDINGDGKEDILGFYSNAVYVGISNGSSFGAEKWSNNFGSDEYVKDINPVIAADINGDGLPDLIAFSDQHVDLSLNTGSKFASKQPLFDVFSSETGWRMDRHLRFVKDIDNDELADIVGMGDGGVFVSLSQGENYEEPKLVIPDFGFYAGSWDVMKHIRMLVDVNGDGLLDIVGFKNKGVLISLNLGMGKFDQPFMAIDWFGQDMSAGGWDSRHPRYVSDVNGDGKGDIIGFAVEGVYVSTATIE